MEDFELVCPLAEVKVFGSVVEGIKVFRYPAAAAIFIGRIVTI